MNNGSGQASSTTNEAMSLREKTERSEEQQNVESAVPAPAALASKEDYVAWLQVVGAFCLNMNTW